MAQGWLGQTKGAAMIDYLAIGVTHLLLLVAALRLLSRGDLDREVEPAPEAIHTQAPPPTAPATPVPHSGVARLPRRPRGGKRA
jgi:hypothetical protein